MVSGINLDIESLINVEDFEKFSREVLAKSASAYLETGAGDGFSVRANSEYWTRLRLLPRVMNGVEVPDTTLSLFGKEHNHPIILAPVASHKVFHSAGEEESMRGALETDSIFTYSTHSSLSLKDVKIPNKLNWWFQIYLHRDRQISYDLAEHAVASGASALVLTVDTPVAGYRDLDRRTFPESGKRLTPGQPESAYPNLSNLKRFDDGLPRHRKVLDPVLDPKVTWSDVEDLISRYRVPVVLKGILHPSDARKSFDLGASGIVVSNHGGRNLDGSITAGEVLAEIRREVGPDKKVFVDGGIRRGSDIFRAIALGADAVMVGRPYIWGLSLFGSMGVRRVIEILLTELETTMLLCGTKDLQEINQNFVLNITG